MIRIDLVINRADVIAIPVNLFQVRFHPSHEGERPGVGF